MSAEPLALVRGMRRTTDTPPPADTRMVEIRGRRYLVRRDKLAAWGWRWYVASNDELSPWKECGWPTPDALLERLLEVAE